jgi:hypothetical protein
MSLVPSQRRRSVEHPETHKQYVRVHYSNIVIEDFQREYDPTHGEEISARWDDDDARVLEVARVTDPRCERNPLLPEQGNLGGQINGGWLSITDGQHTFRAGRARGIEWFDVAIVPGEPTYEERAERYLYWHDTTKPQHAYDRFHAKIEAHRPRSIAILNTTVEAGYNLGRTKAEKTLRCISAVESIAKDDEGLVVYAHLLTFLPVWDGQPHQFDNGLILGLGRFLSSWWGRVDDKRLRTKMKGTTPDSVIRSARAHQAGMGSSTRMDYCFAIAFKALYEGDPSARSAARYRLDV